jgi:chromate transporter
MFNEVAHVRAWMDGLTFLDGIALGQVTPGPIVIMATLIGYMQYGLVGGVIATVAIFLPSFPLSRSSPECGRHPPVVDADGGH